MTEVNFSLSVVTLNINGLSSPIKMHRLAKWIFLKNDPTIYHLQDTPFTCRH